MKQACYDILFIYINNIIKMVKVINAMNNFNERKYLLIIFFDKKKVSLPHFLLEYLILQHTFVYLNYLRRFLN